jgi:MFS family permease
MSAFVLMSPLSSTIVAPGLASIAKDLSITEPAEQTMVLSIFVLGFAFGPLVASPLSEYVTFSDQKFPYRVCFEA